MTVEPTAAEVAAFDQAHAAVEAGLDRLVAVFWDAMAEGEMDLIAILGQAVGLRSNYDVVALSDLLSVAIARLAQSQLPTARGEGD